MRRAAIIGLVLLASACFGGSSAPPKAPPAPAPPPPPAFVDRAWRVVAPSDIPPGPIYVFLSDNTMLIASATGPPALGRWTMSGQSLVMIEEGLSYSTDIVELSANR